MRNGLGVFASAPAFLQTSDGSGLAASAEASLQKNDGPGLGATAAAYLPRNDAHGLAATDGASLWRSDEPGFGAFGATFLRRNDGAGSSVLGGFDRYPQNIDCFGFGEVLAEVGADVEMGLSGTVAGDGDSEGPAVAVLDASYREDGWHGGARPLVKVLGVRTGGVAMARGLFAVLAGLALSGDSDIFAEFVAPQRLYALHMPFGPGRLEVPSALSAPCRLGAPRGLSAPCRLAAAQRLFVLGRPDAVQTLSLLGSFAVLGTFFAPLMPFAPRTPAFLLGASPDKLAAPGMLADLGSVAVPCRPFAPRAPASLCLPAALHRLIFPGRPSALELLHGRGCLPL